MPDPAASALGEVSPPRERATVRGRVLQALRPLPPLIVVGALSHLSATGREVRRESDPTRALTLALADVGLTADRSDVRWVDEPRGSFASRWREKRALVRASAGTDPADVWSVSVRLSPESRLLEVVGLYNLTDTSAVDERQLVSEGERAAWTLGGGGRVYSAHLLDLGGEPSPSGEGWSHLARLQNRLTNLQETGRLAGVGRRSFKLEPAPEQVALAFVDDALSIDADGRTTVVPLDGGPATDGARFVVEQQHDKARPGNFVTWAVDRVRALPWFGSDRMQAVKAIAFTLLDWVQRVVGNVTGDDGSQQVKDELGELIASEPPSYTDPETGWPPPPLEPMLEPALAGEGQWRAVDKDPFVQSNPGAPPAFVSTFIRTDSERAYSQIWIMLWDPRQVALHAMSGTVEPKSATGETGPGMVPRKPEVMGRFVAAFNGGFQASHGEYGMMADGVVYLPPKPYSATVAELSDGATAFGTWPNAENVPDDIISFRQNLTPLVMDGKINPYKRDWWGGVPPGWTDKSRTTRSALCLTKEGFIAFVYGASVDADRLAFALQRARCVYGIHLDMNAGHTGLEFYRAAPAEQLPPLERKLDGQWEAEGVVSDMPGWRFRGRRMLRYMGLMNFPRYIQREARDFFYLTLREVLPGPPLTSAVSPKEAGEGEWRVTGLPQHGWPYAIATTEIRPDAARKETVLRLLKLDARWLSAASAGEGEQGTVVTLRRAEPPGGSPESLWLSDHGALITAKAPGPGALRLASGWKVDDPAPRAALAAIGVTPGGVVVYAEITGARDATRDAALLARALGDAGCASPLLLSSPLLFAIGGERGLGGHPVARVADEIRLVRGQGPAGRRIFEGTAVVPVLEWYPLQAKRIRYFHKPKAAEPGAAPAEPGAAPAAAVGSAP